MNYEQAWLNYKESKKSANADFFAVVYTKESGCVITNAMNELRQATKQMFGIEMVQVDTLQSTGIFLEIIKEEALSTEGFRIKEEDGLLLLQANTQVGLLYAVFELLRIVQGNKSLKNIQICSIPDMKFRMLNHWDNADGSIERGYSGNSFFFEESELIINERTRAYARFLASVGINATVINNVNVKDAATKLITEPYLHRLKELMELFESYGVKLFLSINYAASMELGGLSSADPLDESVIFWWQERMKLVYDILPSLGGFLVKADSEGRPGPFTYGRNQADGANMLAKAIEPFDGTIIWRCFVYNCQQDWRDKTIDRARAAYDYFYDLDGAFLDNVILQIKNGPLDFQVREPFMPLFGKLKKTNHIMEVQIAQEYTGQQIDLCYLIPWFKELLDTRTYCEEKEDTIGDLLKGNCCNQKGQGLAAVANTGNDANWTGHDLAAANLYGFGRLAWNSALSAEEIAKEWVIQTFSEKEKVVNTITNLLLMSWNTYEKYTAPLGVGFMVSPNHHYGPSIDGYEYSRWGTYHRADHFGIGVDRTKKGTGFATLYHEPLATLFGEKETCPDELLLFFHHVDYHHRLNNGNNVIQHIYDTHFEGVEEVKRMIAMWKELEHELPNIPYERVLERFQRQLTNAKEWCDQINSYFYRKSAIADKHQRDIY